MSPLSTEILLEVPFHDVDMMRIAWHGHYPKYLELARTALLRQIRMDFAQMEASGYGWPVVECHIKYVAPLRYGMTVKVKAEVVEYENRLKIRYLLTDVATGQRLTKAHTVQVAVRMDTGELVFETPAVLRDAIEAGPATPLT